MQTSAQDAREILLWLEEQDDPDLKLLGRDMRARLDYEGAPGKKSGRRWWQGAVLLAEKLRAATAEPDATMIAAALEEQSIRREKARCVHSKKIIFTSEEEAKRAQGKGRKTDRLRTYLCEFCHGWHLTSNVGR